MNSKRNNRELHRKIVKCRTNLDREEEGNQVSRREPRYRNALWSFHHRGSLSTVRSFSTQQRRYEYVSHERIFDEFRRRGKRNGSFDFRRGNLPFQSSLLSLDIAPRREGRRRENSLLLLFSPFLSRAGNKHPLSLFLFFSRKEKK